MALIKNNWSVSPTADTFVGINGDSVDITFPENKGVRPNGNDITYTITYNDDGCSATTTITVPYCASITPGPDPDPDVPVIPTGSTSSIVNSVSIRIKLDRSNESNMAINNRYVLITDDINDYYYQGVGVYSFVDSYTSSGCYQQYKKNNTDDGLLGRMVRLSKTYKIGDPITLNLLVIDSGSTAYCGVVPNVNGTVTEDMTIDIMLVRNGINNATICPVSMSISPVESNCGLM